MTFDPKEARALVRALATPEAITHPGQPFTHSTALPWLIKNHELRLKSSETLAAALDEIERLREALGEVIYCNHHNITDGPPPKYVRIARAALKGADQ